MTAVPGEWVRVCPVHGVVWRGDTDEVRDTAYVCTVNRCTHYAVLVDADSPLALSARDVS